MTFTQAGEALLTDRRYPFSLSLQALSAISAMATEPDNGAALATYRAAGAVPPEPGVTLGWTFGQARVDSG